MIDFGDEGNANVSLLQLKTPLIFERGGHQLWKLKLLEWSFGDEQYSSASCCQLLYCLCGSVTLQVQVFWAWHTNIGYSQPLFTIDSYRHCPSVWSADTPRCQKFRKKGRDPKPPFLCLLKGKKLKIFNEICGVPIWILMDLLREVMDPYGPF